MVAQAVGHTEAFGGCGSPSGPHCSGPRLLPHPALGPREDPCGLAIVLFSSCLFPILHRAGGQGYGQAGQSASPRRQALVRAQGPGWGHRMPPTPSSSSALAARPQSNTSRTPCPEGLWNLFGSCTQQAGMLMSDQAAGELCSLPLTWHGCPGHCGDEQNPPGTLNRWCHF